MTTQFRGLGAPLDSDGFHAVAERLRVGTPEIWAVLNVETRGCGFLPDRRPAILFERHVFSRRTNGKFDDAHPDISNPLAGGYGAGGAAQYDRLHRAVTLNRAAALESASWGIGQVMGFNAPKVGYADVEAMVAAMTDTENAQLLCVAEYLVVNKLDNALRAHDWAGFARGYNGSDYAINSYDIRLAAGYQKMFLGPAPDLVLRAAQMYLIYLGYVPGPVDGVMGRLTRSALNEFREKIGAPQTDHIGEEEIAALREAVRKLDSGA